MVAKLLLLGDGGVGKSTFVTYLRTSTFESRYIPTNGFGISDINNNTITIWDTAGQDNLTGLRDGYYLNSTACIIFCASNDNKSIEYFKMWYTDITRFEPSISILIVVNKKDLIPSIKLSNYRWNPKM